MAISLRPDFAEAHSNLGVALAAQGLWDEAAEQYQRAMSLKPDLIDVYRNLGRVVLMEGRRRRSAGGVMRGLADGEPTS